MFKGKYNKEANTIEEVASMDAPEVKNGDYFLAYGKIKQYEEHCKNLRTLPVIGSPGWEDGSEISKDKDFKIEYQYYWQAAKRWVDCGFKAYSIWSGDKRIFAIPITAIPTKTTTMEDYYWETWESHENNSVTMTDYLENHLPGDYEVILHDGSYAEIKQKQTLNRYAVHASGNGDFLHHCVKFELLDKGTAIPKEGEYCKCTCRNDLEYSNCAKKCERILAEKEGGAESIEDISVIGDKILSKLKKNKNHITTQLTKDETISYNTGFHSGFKEGYMCLQSTAKTSPATNKVKEEWEDAEGFKAMNTVEQIAKDRYPYIRNTDKDSSIDALNAGTLQLRQAFIAGAKCQSAPIQGDVKSAEEVFRKVSTGEDCTDEDWEEVKKHEMFATTIKAMHEYHSQFLAPIEVDVYRWVKCEYGLPEDIDHNIIVRQIRDKKPVGGGWFIDYLKQYRAANEEYAFLHLYEYLEKIPAPIKVKREGWMGECGNST